jgi:hypothetical protein
VPHQQRQLALAVLRQEILYVHLLDHVLAVRIELGERAAGLAHDLADRLAGNLRDAPADMERAHAAQHDVVVRERRQRDTHGDSDQGKAHRPLPVLVGSLLPICRHIATVGNASRAAGVGPVPFTPD